MKWQQETPSSDVWTVAELAYHLRLDADLASNTDEQAYLTDLQAAAVEFAETAMGTSLITRAITATYYPQSSGYTWGEQPWIGSFWERFRLKLPRGPVISITSVTDANGAIDDSKYDLEGAGVSDLLRLSVGYAVPLTVVYDAGYGDQGTSVPADIRHAIRQHVSTLYEQRESVSEKTTSIVPHSLELFYARKSRNLQAR